MSKFRKVAKFIGTKKRYKLSVFLQYYEPGEGWMDVLDITRCLAVEDGILAYPWETPRDEAKYKAALEYEQLKHFR